MIEAGTSVAGYRVVRMIGRGGMGVVYEVGESEHGLFMSMRLVSGQTMLDLLRDGELGAERILNLLDQVTDAQASARWAMIWTWQSHGTTSLHPS